MAECVTCGTAFEPTRAWNKYCSRKCMNNAPSKRLRTNSHQRQRREILNEIKLHAGCAECGFNAHPAALHFHHAYGDKSFNISQDPKVARDLLIAEICKCIILCANCHSIHTYEERHWHTKRKDHKHDSANMGH